MMSLKDTMIYYVLLKEEREPFVPDREIKIGTGIAQLKCAKIAPSCILFASKNYKLGTEYRAFFSALLLIVDVSY